MPYLGNFVGGSGSSSESNFSLISLDDGSEGAPSLSYKDDVNLGIYSPAQDNLAFITDGTERLRITSDGNVGIGTSTPSERLEVDGVILSSGPIVDTVWYKETWPSGDNVLTNNDLGTWTITNGSVVNVAGGAHVVDKANLPKGLNAIVWARVADGNTFLTSPTIDLSDFRTNEKITTVNQTGSLADRSVSDSRIYLTMLLAAQSMDSNAEHMEVQLSNDDGVTFHEHQAFVWQDNDADSADITDTTWRKVVIDISEYTYAPAGASSYGLKIRFMGTGIGGADTFGVSNMYIHDAPIPNKLKAKTLKLGDSTLTEANDLDYDEYLEIVSATDTFKGLVLNTDDNVRDNYVGMQGADCLVLAADELNAGNNSRINFRIDGKDRMKLYTSTNDGASEAHLQLIGHASPTDRSNWRISAHDDSTKGYFAISDYSGGNWNENLTIHENGNVGIGTDNPDTSLHIKDGTASPMITLENPNDNTAVRATYIRHKFDDGFGGEILCLRPSGGAATDAEISFRAGGLNVANQKMVIKSTGNVGIGTDSPSARLHVYGTTSAGGILVEDSSTSTQAPAITVIGKRSDGNAGHSFSGKLLLARNKTDGKITNNIKLGTLGFGGNHTDGTMANILYAASIHGVAEDSFDSATDMPTALTFHTGSVGRSGDTNNVLIGAERMRIDSSGNVGLGTDNPLTKLEVVGDITITNGTQNNVIRTNAAGQLQFLRNAATNNTVAVTIDDETGNVGIGTDDPTELLTLGSTATSNHYIRVNSANNSDSGIKFYSDLSATKGYVTGYRGNGNLFFIQSDNAGTTADRLVINDSGNVGIGTDDPASKLDVHGTGTVARFGDLDNVDQLNIRISSGYPTLYCPSSTDSLQLASLGSVQVAINSNNNTGESFRIVADGMDSGGSEIFEIGTEGSFKVSQANPDWTSSTNHPILMWDFKSGIGDMMYMASGGNSAIANQMALVISDGHGFKVGKSGWDGSDTDISSTNEFFRVTTSGKVGIGTSDPQGKLHVEGGNSYAYFKTNTDGVAPVSSVTGLAIGWNKVSGSRHVNFVCNSGQAAINGNGGFQFSTQTNTGTFQDQVMIKGDGNVGIGTNDPAEKLDVRGNLVVGGSASSNYIAFKGTTGDLPGPAGRGFHSYIGERIYESGTERSELLILKDNDSTTNSGPDRVRIVGANIRFDTYDANNIHANFEAAATDSNNSLALLINTDGNVGIGTTNPSQALHVEGNIQINGGVLTSLLTATIADDAYLDVVMPVKGGIIAITSFTTYDTYAQPNGTGLIFYDAGTSRNASVMVDASNTLETSTSTATTVGTFTDGKTTIAMVNSTGTIRIWNRMNSSRQYKITLL